MNSNSSINGLNDKPKKVGNWIEKAKYRKANKKWLGYSGEIAMRILALIEKDKELNQKKIADSLGVSQQYISKVIQGKENLSLDTIGKLSEVLNFELITFPSYKYQNTYVADTESAITCKVVAMTRKKYAFSPNDYVEYNMTESIASTN